MVWDSLNKNEISTFCISQQGLNLTVAGAKFEFNIPAELEDRQKILGQLSSILDDAQPTRPTPIYKTLSQLEQIIKLAKPLVFRGEADFYFDGEKLDTQNKLKLKQLLCGIVERLVPQMTPQELLTAFSYKEEYPGIVMVGSDSLLVLSFAFLRLAEHYESPKYKGQAFSREEFLDWHRTQQADQAVTYYDDWGGFNIPSSAFHSLVAINFPDLLPIEQMLICSLQNYLRNRSASS